MNVHRPLVRVYFRTSSLEGRVVASQPGRMKDEFDQADRELLEMVDVRAATGGADAPSPRALVSLLRMVCAATPLEPEPADQTRWGTRRRQAVALRCDGLDVHGAAHTPVSTAVDSWLSLREKRFVALTDAVVTPWGGAPAQYGVVFVNRSAIETAWWQDE